MDRSQNFINMIRQILRDEISKKYGTSDKHRLVKIFEMLPKPSRDDYSGQVYSALKGWAPDILNLIEDLHQSGRLERFFPRQNFFDILRDLFEKRRTLLICIFFLGRLEIETGLLFIDEMPDNIN